MQTLRHVLKNKNRGRPWIIQNHHRSSNNETLRLCPKIWTTLEEKAAFLARERSVKEVLAGYARFYHSTGWGFLG
jgi:hypothetical protein